MTRNKSREVTIKARRTMPTTHGIGPQQPATTTRTTTTPLSRSSHITEVVTLKDVFAAYYDCRRHKRSKRSAVEYEMRYELNNLELWRELNNQTYTPTTSIVFCVKHPKLREVFAADFRDRVVHHLLRPGRRTIHNAISVAKWWSKLKNPSYEDKVRLRARINSYYGLMRHTKSYKIRRKMWRKLKNYKGIISTNKYSKIKLS